MRLTRDQFLKELKTTPPNRTHNIIFIGMSGSGKSYWSKKFSDGYQYKRFELDEMIGASPEIASLIKDYEGRDKAERMGRYFGMPWGEGFQKKEDDFLVVERKFMSQRFEPGTVLDLTGSAIYHPKELKKIANTGLIVYLETSMEQRQEMMKIFLRDPKPVCWSGGFKQHDDETHQQALERCYPELLESRAQLYKKHADVTLPHALHKGTTDLSKLVQEIASQLK